MDISDAFTQEAIEQTNTSLSAEEEEELRNTLRTIFTTAELAEADEPMETIAVLCFVAGRAYQADQPPTEGVVVSMTPQVVEEFLDFLVRRLS